MNPMRFALVMGLLVVVAASVQAGTVTASGALAEGALSLIVSKRCETPPGSAEKTLEWPGLVYARGKPPAWGRKVAGSCRGLDTWVLSDALGAGALWS